MGGEFFSQTLVLPIPSLSLNYHVHSEKKQPLGGQNPSLDRKWGKTNNKEKKGQRNGDKQTKTMLKRDRIRD